MYDFLIIGGGTAGSVLASRLSEDTTKEVCLIEAGPDVLAPGPDDIRDVFPRSTTNPTYLWSGLKAVGAVGNPPRPYAQARVLGGGSSINGMFALRGLARDYDRWEAAGAAGWGWQDVQPWFRQIESDGQVSDVDGQAAIGQNPIQRLPREDWPVYARAMSKAAQDRGLCFIPNINEANEDGFFPMPISADHLGRVSMAFSYLSASVRQRRNLALRTDAQALDLVIENHRVVGARVRRNGQVTTIRAANVVVTAGALHSPALLMRSGIGPAGILSRAGIMPILDRPGVGRNLQNHPYMFFAMTLPASGRMAQARRNFAIAGLRASSHNQGGGGSDLFLFTTGRVSPLGFGTGVAMVGMALYEPFSKGTVTIDTPNPDASPVIDFRMFEDERDTQRMLQATDLARALLFDQSVRSTYNEAFMLPPGQAVNQFSAEGLTGRLLSLGAEIALRGPATFRRFAIKQALHLGASPYNRLGERLSGDMIKAAAVPMGHPVGTCVIGPSEEKFSVVDPSCRVHGIDGLYIADASVMPVIPTANTNLPTIMVAERASKLIAAAARQQS